MNGRCCCRPKTSRTNANKIQCKMNKIAIVKVALGIGLIVIIPIVVRSLTKHNQELEQPTANAFGDVDESKSLDELRETYAAARRDNSSIWLSHNNSCYVYLYRGGGDPSSIVTSFDIDDTIIKPKSGAKFPKNSTDWEFLTSRTKAKIEEVVIGRRARFLMFTNQNGVGMKVVTLDEVQKRIELVVKGLGLPVSVFVATQNDEFTKPYSGMFELFLASFNDDHPVDYANSFFCGDANGPPAFSDSDLKFAQTVGLPFLTPEQFLNMTNK